MSGSADLSKSQKLRLLDELYRICDRYDRCTSCPMCNQSADVDMCDMLEDMVSGVECDG